MYRLAHSSLSHPPSPLLLPTGRWCAGEAAWAREGGVELADVARQGSEGEVAAGVGGSLSKVQGREAARGRDQEASWRLHAAHFRPGKVSGWRCDWANSAMVQFWRRLRSTRRCMLGALV